MTLPKPLETERGELGPAPGPPASPEHVRHIAALIGPATDDGRILVAGRALACDAADPRAEVERLRARLARHAIHHRPNADATTWARLDAIVRGTVRDLDRADRDLERALVIAIDGL